MYPVITSEARKKRSVATSAHVAHTWKYQPSYDFDANSAALTSDTNDDYLVMRGSGEDAVVLMYPREVIDRSLSADNTLGNNKRHAYTL